MRREPALALLIFLLLLMPLPVKAQQANPAAAEVLVEIWPEYDRPDVLVIYRITLAADTQLPLFLTLRIPRAVGEPFNVAMEQNGALYTLQYDSSLQGEWLEVRFTTPSLQVHVEYYDPRLDRGQAERSFSYRWAGDLSVLNMNVRVQQPTNASAMVIKPDMGAGSRGGDGLMYYFYSVGNVEAGTPFDIQFTYQKPDDTLTFSSGGSVAPSQPVDQNTAGRTSFISLLPVGLGVLGLLLAGGGAFWFWQAGKRPAKTSHGQKPARSSEDPHPAKQGSGVYCHKCGKRADQGDLFCRVCGTRLRAE